MCIFKLNRLAHYRVETDKAEGGGQGVIVLQGEKGFGLALERGFELGGAGKAGMGRKPCCDKVGLKRGPWTAEEDGKLVSYITSNGICCWRAIPKLAGLLRCGKSCRLRWTNYLRPDLKRGIFSEAEENLILDLHATLGNRWSRIAAQLPGRTDNEIKNFWNTRLKKRLRSQGLDPATHLPVGSKGTSAAGDDDGDGDDGDGDDGDGDVANSPPAVVKKKAAGPKVRQPKGPKPQLKMCQSKEGPQLVLHKADADVDGESASTSDLSNAGSTVTADPGIVRKLTTAPSFPQAELWKCIKPSSELLHDWDSYNLQSAEFVGESSNSDVFQVEISELDSWTMDTELSPEMSPPQPPPALESMFATSTFSEAMTNSGNTLFSELHPHHQSYELQRLASLLDLI